MSFAADDYLADSHRPVSQQSPVLDVEAELQLATSLSTSGSGVKAKKLCHQCQQWQTRGALLTLADGSKLWFCKPCAIVRLAADAQQAQPTATVSTPAKLRTSAPPPMPVTADPAVQALRRKAVKAIGDKKYEQGRDLLLAIAAQDKADTVALYNAACCEALLGNVFEALALLRRALDAGYANYEHICADPDIASVRRLPQFAQLMELHDPTFDATEFVAANKKNVYCTLPNLDTLREYSELPPPAVVPPAAGLRPRTSAYATAADLPLIRTAQTASNASEYGKAPTFDESPPLSPKLSLEQKIQAQAIVYSSLGAADLAAVAATKPTPQPPRKP